MNDELKNTRHIHFIGIGGSGMSGLARILKTRKKIISGSDIQMNPAVRNLQKERIKISVGQKASNIPPKTQLVIYSPAVPEENPERIAAKKRHIPEYSYPEAVGLLTRTRSAICICGTHGKTTTTAMGAAVFMKAGKDPSVIVGASIKELNHHNAHNGHGPDLIIESCEYRRGFLNYWPQTIIITNVEADHLDYYKNLADYKKAFLQFVHKLPKDGMVIANADDKNIRSILKNYRKAKIVWFGNAKDSDYRLKKNSVYHRNKKIAELKLSIPGEHNLMNALAVLALAGEHKISISLCLKALKAYQGSSRRFETVGYCGKAIVLDDYGHHPTEIKATLKAARERFGKKAKILCVFQPHQFSRTHKLLKNFAEAFQDASEIIIPNIYGVRDSESDIKKINVDKLVREISKHHKRVKNGQGLQNTANTIQKDNHYDVIITMGAGDVYKIAESLTRNR